MKQDESEMHLDIADKGIDILDQEKAFVRAQSNHLYRISLKIIRHNVFKAFVSISIVVNTGVLALDKYPIDPV